jgi:salicylate hydroxylase
MYLFRAISWLPSSSHSNWSKFRRIVDFNLFFLFVFTLILITSQLQLRLVQAYLPMQTKTISRLKQRYIRSLSSISSGCSRSLQYVPKTVLSRPFIQQIAIRWTSSTTNEMDISALSNKNTEKLKGYLRGHLKSAISRFSLSEERAEEFTEQLFHDLLHIHPNTELDNKLLSDYGQGLIRMIRTFSPEKFEKTIKREISLSEVVESYLRSKELGDFTFRTITGHHQDIISKGWDGVTQNLTALQMYSEAASEMGRKNWVREGNEWMIAYALSFFRHGVAAKHFLRQNNIKKYDLPINHEYRNLSKDIMLQVTSTKTFDESSVISKPTKQTFQSDGSNTTDCSSVVAVPRKIKLLDVGSCYNPFAEMSCAGNFDITAVDLYPATASVFQCDFLKVNIGPKGSAPIISEPDPKTGFRQVIQLPAHSYDIVTMSLVLSYLSDPGLREAMVLKARKLLVSGLDTGVPHYNGLLCIVEKDSIFSKNRTTDNNFQPGSCLFSEWKRCISTFGFNFVKYSVIGGNKNAKKANDPLIPTRKSHGWVFSADKVVDFEAYHEEQQKIHIDTFGSRSRLWIKQDFLYKDASNEDEESDGDGDDISTSSSVAEKAADGPLKSNSPFNTKRFLILNQTRAKRFYPIGIIGGGLGGTALALALQKKGLDFKLFEKDEDFDFRRQGYALTMQQGGITLRELGIVDEVKSTGVVSTAHYSFDAKGRRLGAYGMTSGIDSDFYTHQQPSSSQLLLPEDSTTDTFKQRHNVQIPRQKLREVMLNKLDPKRIYWNKRLLGLSTFKNINSPNADENAVELDFADGTSDCVSIVIGADGIFSRVRQLLKQDEFSCEKTYSKLVGGNDLRYLDLMVILGISNTPSTYDGHHFCQRQWLDGSTRVFTMPYDKQRVMWQLSYPMGEIQALGLSSAHKRSDEDVRRAGRLLKEEAIRKCAAWDPVLLDLFTQTEDHLLSGHPVYDRNPVDFIPTFSKDGKHSLLSYASRATLIGDAAHPMSPFKGQGANQALLDALYLSKAILSSEYCKPGKRSIETALREYERDMVARTQVKVMKSREAAKYLHSSAALAEGNITRAKAAENALRQAS